MPPSPPRQGAPTSGKSTYLIYCVEEPPFPLVAPGLYILAIVANLINLNNLNNLPVLYQFFLIICASWGIIGKIQYLTNFERVSTAGAGAAPK